MKRHRYTILICASFMVMCLQAAAQNMASVRDESGRTVWVNNDVAKPEPALSSTPAKPATRLAYWSRTEHRWKPVRTVTPAQMTAARRAAEEVTNLITPSPRVSASFKRSEPVSPDAASVRARPASSETVDSAIESAALRHGVDPNLVRAVIKVE